MNLQGKAISVLGAAKSGLAAAKTLAELGADVFISDIQSEAKLLKSLTENKLIDIVKHESGGHSEKVLESEIIILSPGIRTDIEILQKAQALKIPIYSEIEIAYKVSRGKRLVVTGSNGKTTTTTLLSKFCSEEYEDVYVGGNIGIPMMSFAAKTTNDSIQVLEVSSFQLETISEFKPDIAIITNFYENHLDRYPNYQAYIDAKKRVAMNMQQNDWLILNSDQKSMNQLISNAKCKIAWFGWNISSKKPAITSKNKQFVYISEDGNETVLFPLSAAKIMGEHNSENIMASMLAALLVGVKKDKLLPVIENFKGVEHRLEWVKDINGVSYINDSKGTNCAATVIALRACKQPLILIAGGRDKGTDLSDWVDVVRKSVKGVVLYGEAKQRFRSALEGLVPIKVAVSFEEAVDISHKWSVPGDTVLLSPSCSSYDLFPNFEARGQRFKELVRKIKP